MGKEYSRPLVLPIVPIQRKYAQPSIEIKSPLKVIQSRYKGDFIVYWDYIINILSKFSSVKISYGVFNNGDILMPLKALKVAENAEVSSLKIKINC